MRPFRDCPNQTIITLKRRHPDYTNEQLAYSLRILGYSDATKHNVRRRVTTIRYAGGLDQLTFDDELQ